MNIGFIPQLGLPELLIILVVMLLLFGGKKLPGLSRALGRSLSEFKRGKQEGAKSLESVQKDEDEDGKKDEEAEDKKDD